MCLRREYFFQTEDEGRLDPSFCPESDAGESVGQSGDAADGLSAASRIATIFVKKFQIADL